MNCNLLLLPGRRYQTDSIPSISSTFSCFKSSTIVLNYNYSFLQGGIPSAQPYWVCLTRCCPQHSAAFWRSWICWSPVEIVQTLILFSQNYMFTNNKTMLFKESVTCPWLCCAGGWHSNWLKVCNNLRLIEIVSKNYKIMSAERSWKQYFMHWHHV